MSHYRTCTLNRVTIERPFLLSATEVSQYQFLAVMGRNPSYFKGDLHRPVEQVNWFEAVEFCNRFSERLGLSPRYEIADESRGEGGYIDRANVKLVEGTGYRLPSEAEWEYACRAGTETDFSFGDTTDPKLLEQYMWYGTNSHGTNPVRSKKPNEFGLFDMHGNVWEWCQDEWHGSYDGAPTTQQPWIDGGKPGASRVLRGGGWINYPEVCRSAFRRRSRPEGRNRYHGLGFRVALDPG